MEEELLENWAKRVRKWIWGGIACILSFLVLDSCAVYLVPDKIGQVVMSWRATKGHTFIVEMCLFIVVVVPVSGIPIMIPKLMENDILDDRIKNGYCPKCGYNLCTTPHRCPECGYSSPLGSKS